MKNKPLITGLIYATLIGLCFYFLSSCNPYGYEIWPEGDPHWGEPPTVDTLPIVVDTFVYDTCSEYHSVPNQNFFCWHVNLDGLPVGLKWYYDKANGADVEVSLDSMLSLYGTPRTYYSGINIGGTVTGSSDGGYLSRVYAIDLFGNLFYITPFSKSLVFFGALTFDQYMAELTLLPGVKRLAFGNTAYSCEQMNQIVDFLLADCKLCKFVIDLGAVPGCIDSGKIDELKARGAEVWL